MPYITQKKRGWFNCYIKSITNIVNGKEDINSLLAYIIYKIIVVSYNKLNWDKKSDALKVLEDVKLEYYRRVLVPHANKKIIEHGDI